MIRATSFFFFLLDLGNKNYFYQNKAYGTGAFILGHNSGAYWDSGTMRAWRFCNRFFFLQGPGNYSYNK